ncbi:MAG: MATE family efflux transporter [Clostridiales bacterium]|nr:MATE family efflux transporter [Clostridiales bacterium]
MNQNHEGVNQITEGNILRQLLAFFFPILLGTFFQQLYNTADAIVVGNYVGTVALAAVGGSTGTLIGLFVNVFVGIASGTTVVIAQCYGARDFEGVRRTVHTSVAFAVVAGGVCTLITLVASPWALRAMGSPEDVIPSALIYLRVYAVGMIPSFLYNIGAGILRAVGDTKRPLYFLIIACLTNIVLDVAFVLGLGWGVFGVAAATVISQIVSCVLVMLMLMRSTTVFSINRSEIRFTNYSLNRVLHVGVPSAVQGNMYTIANIIIQSVINSFGTMTVAAWTAYSKVDGFFWMIMSALGISVTTFVGQNFGAQNYKRIRQSARIGLVLGLIVAVACGGGFMLFADTVLGWFTSSAEVLSIGVRIMELTMPFYFTYIAVEVLSGTIRGTGDSFIPMMISASGICLLRILWVIFALPVFPGFDTVVIVYPISWAATSLLFIAYYLQGGWLRRRISIMGYAPEKPAAKQ